MNFPVNRPVRTGRMSCLRAVRSLLGSASILSACFLVHHAHGGDVIGKVVTGYQGWLSAPGDGSSANQWKHTNLECWPDVREYTTTFSGCPFSQAGVSQPGYTGNLGNGSPARIFSSWSDQTVNKHFEWMQYYKGIDCVALQRFGSELGNTQLKAWKNGIATKVRSAAETYGRKYYIMYDISGWTNFQSEIKTDWTALKGNHITSPAYAMEAGKPVVCLWGMGFSGRPGNAQSWKDMLDWFKDQGCYVIGGLTQSFHTDSGSYTDPVTQIVTTNQAAYKVCDMVMVWTVGKTSDFATLYSAGLNWCNANGKEYQADVYPGTAFYNTDFDTDPTAVKNKRPRMHGDFMWSQFAAVRSSNVQSVYISMFDEIQEATQIFKTAEDSSMVPDGKYFLTLDADGIACSSDFYLRLTKDGSDMIKGITPHVTAHPTPHIVGGNLVLNPSFEVGGTSPISWARGGSAVGSTVSAQDGSNSLRIATAGANAPTTQTIPIQVGKIYNLSVWINAAGRTSGNVVFDTSDQYDGAGQGQFVLSSANAGWTKYSGSFTATTASVTLRMFTEATFGGTVYFDNIVLESVNDAPVAASQSVTTAEDTARAILLSGTDSDYNALTYAIVTQPTNGILSGTVPNVIYTPAANFTGTDTFNFTVHDGIVASPGAAVTITVTTVSDPPTIIDITDKSTNENTATPAIAFTIGDAETAATSLVITSSSSNTSLVPLANVVLGGSGANRTVTVTPAANQSGTSTITLTVSDGTLTASDTFVLTVIPNGPVNLVLNPSFELGGAAPTSWNRGGSAVGSMVSAQDGVNSLRIATAGSNGSTTQVIPIQSGKIYNLSVWINASGMTSGIAVFDTNDTYDGAGQGQFALNTANAGWTKYSGSFTANTASVTLRMFTGPAFAGTVYFDNIVLEKVNDAPVAASQSVTTAEDTARSILLSGSDSDYNALTYAIVTQPTNGTLSGTAPNVIYTPAANFTGTDTFDFTVNDGIVSSAGATVTITVTPVNDPPTITDITDKSTIENTATSAIALTIGDDETAVTSLVVTSDSSNTSLVPLANVVLGGSGANRTVTVTPATNQSGTSTITLTVSDGILTASDTFVLTVTPNGPVNLVLNPSFEMGETAPTSWTRAGSAVGSTASAQDGSNSLMIATAGNNNPTTQAIPIQVGKTYNLSVWINASGMTSGIAVFDTNDTYDGAGQGQFVMNTANAGWTKYSGSFTANSTSVTLRMFTGPAFAGTVFFDSIVLAEAPVAPFTSWVSGYFQGSLDPAVIGFKADPDSDGLANGLEFVLGGNPAINDAASIMPSGARVAGNYVFTYKRSDASKAGTPQIVQYGNNPGAWTDVTIAAAGGSSGGATYTVDEGTPATDPDTIVVSIPHNGADHFFARLKIIQP